MLRHQRLRSIARLRISRRDAGDGLARGFAGVAAGGDGRRPRGGLQSRRGAGTPLRLVILGAPGAEAADRKLAGLAAARRPRVRQDPNRRRAGTSAGGGVDGTSSGARRTHSGRRAQCDGGRRKRSGNDPRVVVTTTPRPTKLIRAPIADPTAVVTRGSTYENQTNLAPAFLQQIIRKYEGTRLGRQELDAEILDDVPGALWTRGVIEASRACAAPPLIRVVVAIDPAATSSEHADETGIIVAGMVGQGQGWVLADVSGRYPPAEWAKTAIAAYRSHRADRAVAEVNNGGEMVEATLRVIDPNVSFAAVRASRGKLTRAEPVAALYEQGRVHHLGVFPQLEDQMCGFAPADHGDFGQRPMGCSPDRADALVWALTDLLIEPMSNQGIYDLYRQLASQASGGAR